MTREFSTIIPNAGFPNAENQTPPAVTNPIKIIKMPVFKGQIISEKPNSEIVEFYPNGKIMSKMEYDAEGRIKAAKTFDLQGKIETVRNYKYDEKSTTIGYHDVKRGQRIIEEYDLEFGKIIKQIQMSKEGSKAAFFAPEDGSFAEIINEDDVFKNIEYNFFQNGFPNNGTNHNDEYDKNWQISSIQISDKEKTIFERSEERRVGKECRSRWSPYH